MNKDIMNYIVIGGIGLVVLINAGLAIHLMYLGYIQRKRAKKQNPD